METPAEQRIVFYNTMTRRKEVFREREPGTVRIFTCGPSIYRRPHLGNYRTFVFEDVLQRYLEYRGFDVHRMINFTDLEDKAITESEEKSVSLSDLTEPNAQTFLSDGKLLKLKLPEPIPRSTTSVDQAAELIARLIENGHAYWHDGNVYYDALSHPTFGAVYGLDMSRWPKKRYRFSRDTYPGQRWNLGDFILWHGHREGQNSWDTKIGRGRPAWNVQDPAMITKHMGYELDIHCGGIDNVYRHHDYNRAVVEGVSGTELAHYWLHGEHLFVDNQKMSKSKGNVVYPENLVSAGRSGTEIRFFLLYGYYRRKGNLTNETLDRAGGVLQTLRERTAALVGADPDRRRRGAGGADAAAGAGGAATAGDTTGARGSREDGSAAAQRGVSRADTASIDQLVSEITPLFTAEMDNDLHTDAAIDNVSRLLQVLVRRKEEISPAQRERIRTQLTEIDHVLQVLDLAD